MRCSSMLLSLILFGGCEEPPKRAMPLDPSVTDTGAESSSSTAAMRGDPCAAFDGCMLQCTGDDCARRCASATDSDEALCTELRCDALRDACAQGDHDACADVLACATSTSSETSTDSSTEDGSSSST